MTDHHRPRPFPSAPPSRLRRTGGALAAACALALLPVAVQAADGAPMAGVMPMSPLAPVAPAQLVMPVALAGGGNLPAGSATAGSVFAPSWTDTPAQTLRAEALRHEHGEGLPRDPARAAALYCMAAVLGDAPSQYNLGWMYANGRGVERNDAWAAYFFKAAAEQGIEQAARMLGAVGGVSATVPDCVRPPVAASARDARSATAAAAAAATAAVAPPPARPPTKIIPPKAIAGLVQTLAPAYGVEPQLALAIMKAESNFDPQALSPKNAMGLMQLIPETAERFRVKDAFDPKQNISGGLAYLRWLLAYFEGDVALVAAAYNSGEGTVERYRGVPPYAETRGYVGKVLAAVGALVHPFDSRVTQPSSQLRFMQKPTAAALAGVGTSVAAAPAAARAAAAATTGPAKPTRQAAATVRATALATAAALDAAPGGPRSPLGRPIR